MTWLRTEEEVEMMIEEMSSRSKGKYITQGVAFNKTCPRQMELLKKALMSSISFSGLGKELLAVKFNGNAYDEPIFHKPKSNQSKSFGNFV